MWTPRTDGHSGLENRVCRRSSSGPFEATLSILREASGQEYFVLHVTSGQGYSRGLQPIELLGLIGLSSVDGHCQFYGPDCRYRVIAGVPRPDDGVKPNADELADVQRLTNAFEPFIAALPRLFALRQEEADILERLSIESLPSFVFANYRVLSTEKLAAPSWVDTIKFRRLLELEPQRVKIEAEIAELERYLPLLHASSDPLEDAVVVSLKALGLTANRTPKASNIDILADSLDGVRRFGIEVTGINTAVTKQSPKLTQLSIFAFQKDDDQKPVLVANTFRDRPIADRATLQHFTPQVIDYFKPHRVLLMTGWDLYQIVRDVLEQRRAAPEIVDLLYTSSGVLKYPPK